MVDAPSAGPEAELATVTSADGTEIVFDRTGSGPPLVLVYGNGDVREFWEGGGVRSALAEHATVYAIERRGRGSSGDSPEYAIGREAEDIVAVIEALDEPAALLGHSGGAIYALEAAVRTDDLRALILYEPPIQVGDHELDIADDIATLESLVADGQHERTLVSFYRNIAGITAEELDGLRSAPIWPAMVAGARTLPRELKAIREYTFVAARIATLTVPTLLLTGGDSPPFYRDATEALVDALPNSRVATFSGEQHMAMRTAPERFVAELQTFLGETS